MNGLDNKCLFCFGQFAEINIEILQGLVICIDIVVVIVGFSEQVIGRRIKNIRNFDDLFKSRARTTNFPAADGRLLDAKSFSQFSLGCVVFFAQSFQNFCKHNIVSIRCAKF